MDSAHSQPACCRARPASVYGGLEDIRWVHGLEAESLPAASYGLLPNQKNAYFCAIRDGSRKIVICFVHVSGPLFFYHTPGQRPPHITGHCVNTVTLGWIGAPNERTPSIVYDAVVGFVDRCLSRTRNSNCTSA